MFSSVYRSAFALLLLGLLSACSSAQRTSESEAQALRNQARNAKEAAQKDPVRGRKPGEIAPGFEIAISCVEDQNLNGRFRVSFEGQLKLPYNVTVDAEGHSKSSLHQKLQEAYAKYFKSPPSIDLSVVDEKYWIDVRGLVEKPGRFLIKKTTSLDEVIALAGGTQKTATVRYVRILQPSNPVTIKLSDYYAGSAQDQLPKWQGGEVIFLQSDRDPAEQSDHETSPVLILGEVRTPGEYRYIPGTDFYSYLARAGGPTDRANLNKIEVFREYKEDGKSKGKKSTIFELSDSDQVPAMQGGDLVILHADKPTATERTVSLVSGVVGILNTALLLILIF